jgi:murein DD-endopeptidase MepM/ murein hydrolase activator NlpD
MSRVIELSRSRLWPRAAALTLLTIGVAACSGESTRFSDNPYRGNPEATGSIPQGQTAPVGRVDSRPLPPQSAQAQPAYPAGGGTAGGGRGLASYTPGAGSAHPPSATAARPMPPATTEVTGSVAPAQRPAPAASGHWTWDGGTPMTVVQGDTVDSIARRYGVPASAIIQSNNLTMPPTVHPGQQLVIPRYSATPVASAAPPRPALIAPPHKPAPLHVGNPGVHVVAAGETLSKISRLYGKPVGEIAKANNITASAKLNVGDRLVIPGVRTSQAKPLGAQPKAPALAQAKAAPLVTPQSETEIAPSASVFTPVTDGKDSAKSADATGALPKFRWPANGRVISGHGPLPNGQQNDGINIALPEGTQVKAAEDGVVAYAGSELKGYGNLILIRHANGYVTAYAHAKELLVKRGDQVKRGQVILRSGQTGNVNTPQLHFEVRKGATPMDPMKFLNGA